MSKEQFQRLVSRANYSRQTGYSPESSPELDKILKFLHTLQPANPLNQARSHSQDTPATEPPPPPQPLVNGHTSAINGVIPFTNGAALNQPHPPPPAPPSPVSFTQDQISALRVQIHAYKLISRGIPVPEPIQQALRPTNQAIPGLEKLLRGPDVPSTKSVSELTEPAADEDTIKAEEQDGAVDLPANFLDEDTSSTVYPYNAYAHSFTHLKCPEGMSPSLWATRLQRLLVPTVMPAGLDPHQIIAEFIEARIEQSIRELSTLPPTIGDGGLEQPLPSSPDNENEMQQRAVSPLRELSHAHSKLCAIIELKALEVHEKQRALCAQVVERLTHGTLLPLDRKDFRPTRKPALRGARQTEGLERKQRQDRERRAKQKHLEQLQGICAHSREMVANARAAQDQTLKVARAVQAFHAFTEKEEAKRIERISKERLKALKVDDEKLNPRADLQVALRKPYGRAKYELDIDVKVIQAGRFDNKLTLEDEEGFLRSILEAKPEEDNEESGDMNDEEINLLIACDDQEVETFCIFGGSNDAKELDESLEGHGHRRDQSLWKAKRIYKKSSSASVKPRETANRLNIRDDDGRSSSRGSPAGDEPRVVDEARRASQTRQARGYMLMQKRWRKFSMRCLIMRRVVLPCWCGTSFEQWSTQHRAPTFMDEDNRPPLRQSATRTNSKQVLSDDDEYLTPSVREKLVSFRRFHSYRLVVRVRREDSTVARSATNHINANSRLSPGSSLNIDTTPRRISVDRSTPSPEPVTP
ncbi:hypothetical protein BD410DRAFT_840947 [Rickenella mellea]|uniref:Uncharacterized protein n=1 Tax=Rickenella mellea TaxID=50990 RepID=A0A4Y7Q180_9AGAM|nr:hypothetical protein BD410DRAFT_840947 [Rickenella mellea]